MVFPLNGFVPDPETEPDRLKLDNPDAMQRLYNTITEHGLDVIVLDVLREFHDRAENDSDEMGPLLRGLREMTHALNITTIVTHHQNRTGTFRGSTAILAAFDLQWSLVRHDDSHETTPRGALTAEGRSGPRENVHIAFGDSGCWHLTDAPPTVQDSALRDRILNYLAMGRRWKSAEQIAKAFKQPRYSLRSVLNAVTLIVTEAPCPVAGQGIGKKNDPRRYGALDLECDEEREQRGMVANQVRNHFRQRRSRHLIRVSTA